MPVKKVKKVQRAKVARRSTRVASPAHKAKTKTSKVSRSLSESRRQSSVKTKKVESRLSIAPQADKRRAPSLSASVYNLKGKVVEKVSLPKEIFGSPVNDRLMAQAVRVYLANQRLGTVSTKTRGEVRGSTRKIYRQKGTGRARHGGIRAPIFVGGGRVFGPKPRDFSLKLPSKMRKAALVSALSQRLLDNGIRVISGLEKIEPKTKIMARTIKNLDSNLERKKILLVTPSNSNELSNVYRAARNIEGVRILPANMLNTYEVLDNVAIFLMKPALDALKKHFEGGTE